ncbi:MAG: hypothetical protein NT120_00300 [Candidatus Aenigmarchaeota archaeon]|nr:hypothetical protein [Candidatus Aenigmarchaeota archaeon]
MKKKTPAVKKVRKAKKHIFMCMRCEKQFPSMNALRVHSKAHLQALRELRMLESGQIPLETKLGSEFKGKNKVIIT